MGLDLLASENFPQAELQWKTASAQMAGSERLVSHLNLGIGVMDFIGL